MIEIDCQWQASPTIGVEIMRSNQTVESLFASVIYGLWAVPTLRYFGYIWSVGSAHPTVLTAENFLNKWDGAGGLLVLGTAVGIAKKAKPSGFANVFDVSKYDPFEYGIIIGLSSAVKPTNL